MPAAVDMWDEVCIVCGLCPSTEMGNPGPSWLLPQLKSWQERYFTEIAAEIVSINFDAEFNETRAIVSEALSLPICGNQENTILHLRQVMPGLGEWSGFKRCMAIGQFSDDLDGAAICRVDESGSLKAPDGRQVEVRLVDGYDVGSFWKVLKENQYSVTEESVFSYCSAYMNRGRCQPNLFVSEGCYHYLHAWIDWTALPPRKHAFPSDPAPLPFGAELYEIVNSKEDLRDDITAALTCIDYDGIVDDQYEAYFFSARRGSMHLARAIREGLRKEELLPAIMQDFRCWTSVRPDMWPHPPMTPRHPYFSVYIVENNSTTMFDVLPVELLLVILGHLSLSSYLSVSATCKSLRSHLTAPGFIDTIIKTAIASGYLRWISPVDAMRGEVNRANEIFSQWRSVYSTKNPKEPNPNSNVPNPLLLIDFPRLAFVHACFRSDSMKNRKRIWGIVKQYDALWIEYRTNGWQKDMFYTKH